MDFVDNQRLRFRHTQLETKLQVHLGSQVAVVCAGVNGDIASLWPDEWAAVSRATPRRQREFAAGRAAAREAVRRLSGIDAPIRANADRSPQWPDGFVGSITHTRDTCLVVVGREESWQSIGIDMEPAQSFDESLWEIVCTPGELHLVRQRSAFERAIAVTRLFVAKEAFYKWYYPQKKIMLDFQNVSVFWSPDESEFKVSSCSPDFTEDFGAFTGQFWAWETNLIAYFGSSTNQSAEIHLD